MRELVFFLGKLGSGKSYIAKKEFAACLQMGMSIDYIEVSDLVSDFAREITGKENPSREDLQLVKEKMKDSPNWLLDSLINKIEETQHSRVIVCGLREKLILDALEKKYGSGEIFIIEARDEVRRERRGLSLDEFIEADMRDYNIGLYRLLESVQDRAKVIKNNQLSKESK